MSSFKLFEFQKDAVEKLTEAFKKLWNRNERQRNLIFQSPTGSGKTVIMCNFIRGLNSLPNWDYDKSIIWITFSDTLAMQSRDKFKEYLDTDIENNLLMIKGAVPGHKRSYIVINKSKRKAFRSLDEKKAAHVGKKNPMKQSKSKAKGKK